MTFGEFREVDDICSVRRYSNVVKAQNESSLQRDMETPPYLPFNFWNRGHENMLRLCTFYTRIYRILVIFDMFR